MSITITCEFSGPTGARQAAERLRRRGYTVSTRSEAAENPKPLLVAYPFGTAGGNAAGNSLMGALPPLAGNGVLLQPPKAPELISVLTDDTEARDARQLLEAMGGHILS